MTSLGNTTAFIAVILSTRRSYIPAQVKSLVVAPIKGYEVFTPIWEVDLSPYGPRVTLSGSVEEVYHQVLQLNPQYEQNTSWTSTAREPPQVSMSSKLAQSQSPKHVTDWSLGATLCGRWSATPVRRIREGIRYLRRIRGQPKSQAGPAQCGRVSCAYDSAIWWCNDDHRPKALSSFASIADGAQLLVKRCVEWMNPQPDAIGGQAFHPHKWNVIIRGDKC
ncbi:hypothetical protein L249_8213 [Ophiocordyceps polyrhachis-furcata BCC 54312]|uniref:Uncharacterized protein n=1 Tax=Ophiocordyceps polyrhachis-furcata BCC 54312 TaxID=1330021 RepID=A0A367LGY5_9HYPO|nr:hypothetical protein L249_8213 [Ophiocordyceps polyrhachis-furcata BCC 54312]